MKKILCFLAVCCLGLTVALGLTTKTEIYAEKEIVELTQDEFLEKFNVPDSSKTYLLKEDISLEQWSPISVSGLNFDGNGFCITTPAPLFSVVESGSKIKNLTIKASPNFSFTPSQETSLNFGLLACEVKGSSFENIVATATLAPEDATPEMLLQNTYGQVSVNAFASTKAGGLFGTLEEGSLVQNCLTSLKIVVTQNDENALSTVVGGFAGEVMNARITNCYASTMIGEQIYAGYAPTVLGGNGKMIVGGFVGKVNTNALKITNVFAGGAIQTAFVPEENVLALGKIFGDAQGLTSQQISHCYSYNLSSLHLIGLGSESNFVLKAVNEDIFKAINNFAGDAQLGGQLLWDSLYEWNTQNIWCKKDIDSMPVLQVFQTFNVALRAEQNSNGLEITMLDADENPILVDDVPAQSIDVKFGKTVIFKISVQEEFLPYKAVKSLMCTTSNQPKAMFDLADNLKEKLVSVKVDGSTSATYFAEAYDLSYNLKVVSVNDNQGQVRVKGATAPIPENKVFDMSYLSSQSFVATASNSSYMFEKWVWVGETVQDNVDAFVSDPDNEMLAGYAITVKFGDSTLAKTDTCYVYMLDALTSNVPFVVENGEITFTLQAQFVQHNEKLNILVSSSDNATEIYVNNVYIDGQASLDGISFEIDVTVGVAVEIKIVVNEGFVFNGWRVENQSFSSLINSQSGETDKSTTIHITPNGALTLYADVQQQEQSTTNLTWLWWALGGVGGAGLLTLIIVIAVKRKRKESFVRYY